MNALKQKWEHLPPKKKQWIVIGAIGAVLFVIMYTFVTANPEMTTDDDKQEIVQDILTGADMRKLGVGGLDNRTARLENKVDTLVETIKQLQVQIRQAQKNKVSTEDLRRRLEHMRDNLGNTIADQVGSQIEIPEPQDVIKPPQPPKPDGVITPEEKRQKDQSSKSDIWDEPAPVAVNGPNSSGPKQPGKPGQVNAPGSIDIRVIGAKEQTKSAPAEGKAAKVPEIYLPAGSIISGVLLTGMDAPTNSAARSHPYPALIRVKADAILPNRYRMDVRECFIVASGYGSLSAERAYLRAEVLSCVRNDGGVIEVSLEAYAVGEDGKVGLRGRVVSKQGQMLAKSLAAGFFSGISQVFKDAPVPTISLGTNDQVQYQDMLSSDALASGAIQGASSALDRLAQFYLNMAKNIFPVIEINANRHIEMVVTQGVSMSALRSASAGSMR